MAGSEGKLTDWAVGAVGMGGGLAVGVAVGGTYGLYAPITLSTDGVMEVSVIITYLNNGDRFWLGSQWPASRAEIVDLWPHFLALTDGLSHNHLPEQHRQHPNPSYRPLKCVDYFVDHSP